MNKSKKKNKEKRREREWDIPIKEWKGEREDSMGRMGNKRRT
jgi:hypothetical protein